MIPSSEKWLDWASSAIPHDKAEWLYAMKAECTEIVDPAERNHFAFGCFKAALSELARSRKGLNYIARACGAAFIIAVSIIGLNAAGKMAAEPTHLAIAKIITMLCLFYMCGAALLIISLKYLKIYASTGLCAAVAGWIYVKITRPSYENLPVDFLTAINFEAAGLMTVLLFTAMYLGWLYTPDIHDA